MCKMVECDNEGHWCALCELCEPWYRQRKQNLNKQIESRTFTDFLASYELFVSSISIEYFMAS